MSELLLNTDKKIIKRPIVRAFSFVFSFFLLYLFSISPSYAGSTLSIDPASATVSGNFDVQINVSTTGASVAGFDITLNYTGAIKYLSSKAGTLNCTPVVSTGSKSVTIACLGSLDFLKNSGSIAILTFTTTGTGTAEMSLVVNDTDGTVDGASGAKFTLKAASSGGSGGSGTTGGSTSTTGGGQLPDTANRSTRAFIMIGGSLLFIGVGFISVLHRYDTMGVLSEEEVENSLVKKVRDNC